MNPAALKAKFVQLTYARHNQSAAVKSALREVLAEMDGDGGLGADIGAGARLHPRLILLERDSEAKPQAEGVAEVLPFRGGSLRAVVSQKMFEYLAAPDESVQEVVRVLRPGGLFYLQPPFIIGYHDGPRDYWRFTRDEMERFLVRAGLKVERLQESGGTGTAAYRIVVELTSVLAGSLWKRAYLPVKVLATLLW